MSERVLHRSAPWSRAASRLRFTSALLAALAWLGLTVAPSHDAFNATASNVAYAADSEANAAPRGDIDVPRAEGIVGPHALISGWALAPNGLRTVEIRIAGKRFDAKIGIARPDVAKAVPNMSGNANAGYEFIGDFSPYPPPVGTDRREISVVAIGKDGRETVLGTRSLIEPAALERFRGMDRGVTRRDTPFYLLPATSGIHPDIAKAIGAEYAPYLSTTMRAGVRVPILYLRSTKGVAHDYVFDPDWDVTRRCGPKVIAEDSLNRTLAAATSQRLPVLFTLNGGVWADAACDIPAWDVNDHLEANVANCQWNEKNEVMPDDYLKHLPGSQDAPELARTLTFNVYAKDVRHYKRRNLQAAGKLIVAFARTHPDLFVGINLDPDTYLNPFFDQQQWYDYNPGTLKQFRQWLASTGPYAGKPEAGVPDLSAYRRAHPLTLAEINRIAGRHFARWDDVDPPRAFPREPAHGRPAFWDDPWTREWETFRRHLVDLHYDELSLWLREAGVARDRIWSSQGFMAPHNDARPFAIHVTSPMQNYDTGGMSVEGAIPKWGHLGAILYGPSAVNDIRMEETTSLFATFHALDPGWAVVEYNTADLREMKKEPQYEAGYRGLRDMFNYGARFVSPMAWNGSNGMLAGQPGYVTFTAWRNTPLEQAARDFLLSHANVPLGTRLWSFGTSRLASSDGWRAERGTAASGNGYLTLQGAQHAVTLVSPPQLQLAPRSIDRLVIGLADPAALASVLVMGRAGADKPWRELASVPKAFTLAHGPAGVIVPLGWPREGGTIDQVKVELTFATDAPQALARIVLWPTRPSARRS